MITAHQLQCSISCDESVTARWLDPINNAMHKFGITTPLQQAAFIAQTAHESARYTHLIENLNYSAEALLRIFPSRFSAANVSDYARRPEKIANRIYALRMGNGTESSGDGFRWRGRGILQITGRRNYEACGAGLRLDLIDHPELLLEPIIAAESAAWYWQRNNLNTFADAGDFDGLSDMINLGHHTSLKGDANGYADRLALDNNTKKYIL